MQPNEMLKQFRESQGLSLRQFADMLNEQLPAGKGTYFMAVHYWETGRAPIPFYLMFYLSQRATGDLKAFAANMCKVMAS